MNFNEFIKVIDGRIINNPKRYNYNLCIDTRKIKENDIFIPVCFKDGNGNNYIKDAVVKGASTVLITSDCLESTNIFEEILEINKDIGIIEIDDGLEVLKRLATDKRNKYNGKIIAITGSNGKTSTKELLSLVLNKKYKTFKSKENFNNILGMCMMLLELQDEEYAVFELGMNHLNEISEMSKILRPHYALITNIGTAHIGNLNSRENILKAKLEIVDGLENDGILFINVDDEMLNCISYNKVYKFNTLEGYSTSENIYIDLQGEKLKLKLRGIHNLYNITAVYYISLYLNIEKDLIVKALKEYKTPRMLEFYIKDSLVIDDSYNANFESMKIGIEYVALSNYKNKILVLGDMLELGSNEIIIHKDIGKIIKNTNISKVYTYGELSKYIGYTCNKISYHYNNVEELIKDLKDDIDKNTIIYVKGSHSMNMHKVIEMLKTSI